MCNGVPKSGHGYKICRIPYRLQLEPQWMIKGFKLLNDAVKIGAFNLHVILNIQ